MEHKTFKAIGPLYAIPHERQRMARLTDQEWLQALGGTILMALFMAAIILGCGALDSLVNGG